MNRMVAFLPLILLAGCEPAGEGASDKVDRVAQVRTAAATMGATQEQVIVYGTAEAGPGGERTLIAPAESTVDRIVSPNGTAVTAGSVIATLRPSRTTATDFARASAEAASANSAYARAKRLRADGLASDADVESARTAAQIASATRANLGGGMTLRAPVAGIVQGLSAKIGDQVAAGTTVASVAVSGNLRARFGIDPAVAQRVRLGQRLELSGLSSNVRIVVPVDGLDRQVDSTTRLASVYAVIPAGLSVGPGSAVRGSLSLASQANGLTIPYAALLDDGGRSYVFVVRGGIAHERDVSPGSSMGDRIQILKGLAAGDKVVIEGGTALDDGMKVVERGAAE